ncbi:hypothetical protein EJB05_14118, partial [Eragrostis curvula]
TMEMILRTLLAIVTELLMHHLSLKVVASTANNTTSPNTISTGFSFRLVANNAIRRDDDGFLHLQHILPTNIQTQPQSSESNTFEPLQTPDSMVVSIGTRQGLRSYVLKLDTSVNMLPWIQCVPCIPHAPQHNDIFNFALSPTFCLNPLERWELHLTVHSFAVKRLPQSTKLRILVKRTPETVSNKRPNTWVDQNHFPNIAMRRDPETGGEPDDLTLFKITHTKNDKWSNTASQNVYDNAQLKILERETEADRLLTPEEENIEFQAAYKETTGSKSSRPHGHGYMAKYPTRREMMNAKLQEQARDAAATKQKNIELEGRVKQLQEQLENEATERDRLLEEHKRQIQEQAEKERNEFKEEMLSLMAKQREDILQQTNQGMNIPHEVAETPTQLKVVCGQGTTRYEMSTCISQKVYKC